MEIQKINLVLLSIIILTVVVLLFSALYVKRRNRKALSAYPDMYLSEALIYYSYKKAEDILNNLHRKRILEYHSYQEEKYQLDVVERFLEYCRGNYKDKEQPNNKQLLQFLTLNHSQSLRLQLEDALYNIALNNILSCDLALDSTASIWSLIKNPRGRLRSYIWEDDHALLKLLPKLEEMVFNSETYQTQLQNEIEFIKTDCSNGLISEKVKKLLTEKNSPKAKSVFQEILRDTINTYILTKGIQQNGYYEFTHQLAGLGS